VGLQGKAGAVFGGPRLPELPQSYEALQELQCRAGHFPPATVDSERVSAAGDFDNFGDSRVALFTIGRRIRHAQRTVLSFSPETISKGPRLGF
jgi:hypothetical protein